MIFTEQMSFITFRETMLRLTPSDNAAKIKTLIDFRADYAGQNQM